MKTSDQMLDSALPVVLVGASPVELGPFFFSLPETWPLVAADGGYDTLVQCGRRPGLVIGDMDSLTDPPSDLPLLHLTGQDDTDFEKCLARIKAPLIVGFGFLDGRLDHSLGALHALTALRGARRVMLCGNYDVRACFHGDAVFSVSTGDRISIWPLGRQTFRSSSGLKWALDGLEMEVGRTVGTSNEATGSQVEIEAGPGDGYAVIMPVSASASLLAAIMPSV